jgi:hypothetical protein
VIVYYNVFSDTFQTGTGVDGMALVRLGIAMPFSYLFLNYIFWNLSYYVLPGLAMSHLVFHSSKLLLE